MKTKKIIDIGNEKRVNLRIENQRETIPSWVGNLETASPPLSKNHAGSKLRDNAGSTLDLRYENPLTRRRKREPGISNRWPPNYN